MGGGACVWQFFMFESGTDFSRGYIAMNTISDGNRLTLHLPACRCVNLNLGDVDATMKAMLRADAVMELS